MVVEIWFAVFRAPRHSRQGGQPVENRLGLAVVSFLDRKPSLVNFANELFDLLFIVAIRQQLNQPLEFLIACLLQLFGVLVENSRHPACFFSLQLFLELYFFLRIAFEFLISNYLWLLIPLEFELLLLLLPKLWKFVLFTPLNSIFIIIFFWCVCWRHLNFKNAIVA